MKTLVGIYTLAAFSWSALWWTPDQQGRRLFERANYAEAAAAFRDPMWQGAAWYRAGEFKKAAESFARLDTPDAHFNRGNALLLQGKYKDAIAQYDQALAKRSDWEDALKNRALAIARAKLVEQKGGDLGDQREGADKIVFDKKKQNDAGQETEVTGQKPMSDAAMQAMWLRRVQTKPADFLKSRFAYQRAKQQEAGK